MNASWIVGAIAAISLSGMAVAAQTSNNRVGANTDWYIFVEENPSHCWVVSAPVETVNTRNGRAVAVKRGDIFLAASFWADPTKKGEVSFSGGYPFAPGSTVELQVGESKFDLFTDTSTEPETAWAFPDDDGKIAAALKNGAKATVTGRSARGTTTKDTFSLIGFTAAFDDAGKRCTS